MDKYYVVIALTFVGFVALAAILLVPVYLFLKKEEDVARHWTDETIARVPADPGEDQDERGSGGSPPSTGDSESEPAGTRASRTTG